MAVEPTLAVFGCQKIINSAPAIVFNILIKLATIAELGDLRISHCHDGRQVLSGYRLKFQLEAEEQCELLDSGCLCLIDDIYTYLASSHRDEFALSLKVALN